MQSKVNLTILHLQLLCFRFTHQIDDKFHEDYNNYVEAIVDDTTIKPYTFYKPFDQYGFDDLWLNPLVANDEKPYSAINHSNYYENVTGEIYPTNGPPKYKQFLGQNNEIYSGQNVIPSSSQKYHWGPSSPFDINEDLYSGE